MNKIKQLKIGQGLARLNFRSIPVEPKRADAHYLTPEHMAWSNAVIRRAGYACQQCGREDGRLFADHIREIKDGGLLYDLSNGQALCGSCHTIKSLKSRAQRFEL
jgi:5-methylcytosine-specific restriction endonuclease McrA